MEAQEIRQALEVSSSNAAWDWGQKGQDRRIAAYAIARRRVVCTGLYQQGSWDMRPRLVRVAATIGALAQLA